MSEMKSCRDWVTLSEVDGDEETVANCGALLHKLGLMHGTTTTTLTIYVVTFSEQKRPN